MIEDTQKNVDQMRLKMNTDSNNSYSQGSSTKNLLIPPHKEKIRNNNYLINEAPKSYRSGASQQLPIEIFPENESGVLSSRRSALKSEIINKNKEEIKKSQITGKPQNVSKSEIKSKND